MTPEAARLLYFRSVIAFVAAAVFLWLAKGL